MRLPRLVWRLRKKASVASTPAPNKSAPPTTKAAVCAGPELSGGGATGFVAVTGLVGGMGTSFAGFSGATLAGAGALVAGAGVALV